MAYVAMTAVAFMTAIVLLQIACRYIGVGFGWTEELSRYLMVWMGMLGASMLVRDKNDMRMEFMLKRFPISVQNIFEAVSMILIFLLAFLLFWFGGARAFKIGMEVKATSLDIVMMPFYLAIPTGGLLIMLHIIARTLNNIFQKGN